MVRQAAAVCALLGVLVLPASVARSAPAAFFCPPFPPPGTNVWTGSVDSLWFTAGNWSAGHVPTSTEQACVNVSTNTPIQIASKGTAEVAQLKTLQSITLTGGTLQLDGPNPSVVQGGTFTVSGGTLSGAGDLDVTGGTFDWNGASTISGTGALDIASGATLTVDGSGTRSITTGRMVTIDAGAAATLSGPQIMLGTQPSELDIGGTLTIASGDVLADLSQDDLVAVLPNGHLIKTGSGTSTVDWLLNQQLVEVDGGELAVLPRGGQTGDWSAAAGATLHFGNSPVWELDGGHFSGAGTVLVTGQVTFNADVLIPHGLDFALGPSLDARLLKKGNAGSLSVAGTLHLGCLLSVTNIDVFILNGGALSMGSDGGTCRIGGTLMMAAGSTGTWADADIQFFGGSGLTVAGSLEVENDHAVTPDSTGSIKIVSGGSLSKSGGAGVTSIPIAFQNDGAVAVNAGTLSLGKGGTDTGTWSVGSGAVLALSGGTHALNGGSLSGAGTVRVSGGETDLGAAFTTPSSLIVELAGGTLGGTGSLTANGTFRWSGDSTLTGASTTTVGGTLTIDDSRSGGNRNLRGGHTLALAAGGTGSWSGADDMQLGEGAALNLGGAFTISNDRTVGNIGGAASLIHVLASGGLTKGAGAGTTTSQIPLTNDGTLTIGSGTLALAGGLTNFDGGTHALTGGAYVVGAGTTLQFAGADVRTNGAQLTLGGAGARLFDGALDGLRNLATNAAGATLTLASGSSVSTSAAFANKGTLAVGVAGPAPGAAGKLQSTGTMTLGGTLALSTVGGFVPALGQAYTILTYPTRSGKLKTITGQAIPGSDLAYDVATSGTKTTLTAKKSADVSVSGSAPATAPAGSTITYTETVHEGGPAGATGVKLTDTLPNGSTFVSATTTAGTCTHTSTAVTCAIGAMPFGGADAVVTIQVTAPNTPGTTLTNKAKVKAKELDLVSPNNTATQKTKLT